MKLTLGLVLAVLSFALFAAQIGKPIYTLEPVPLADVNITDQFWAPKIDVNRTVSIRHLFQKFGDRSYDNPRSSKLLPIWWRSRRIPSSRRPLKRW